MENQFDMNELKVFLEESYFPLKELDVRFHKNAEIEEGRKRNPFQRDYSRVMYSSSFRRLQGKMQLLSAEGNGFYRNRLTHSFEVSQIARGIAEKISKEARKIALESGDGEKWSGVYTDDIYVVETGALAHDIGNPPFGHHGERVLGELMKNYGGFEGNAQSYRVLTAIEKKHPKKKGLNLTLRSLLSITKYYVPYNREKKKFIYEDDYKKLKALVGEKEIKPRTLDVQIIDLADEITYCSHDLEDALSLNYFSIDEFIFELEKFEGFTKDPSKDSSLGKFNDWVSKSKKLAGLASNFNSSEEYAYLFRKELTSNIVDDLIKDIGIIKVEQKHKEETRTQNDQELGFKQYRQLVKALKKCTFNCVTRSRDVLMYERLGTKVIKGLFDALMDDEFNKNQMLMPAEYRMQDKSETQCRERLVCDYIAGMMDGYAIELYKEFYGESSLDGIHQKK